MKESDIQKQIVDYLKARDFIIIRNNSGTVRVGARWINLGDAGSADFIGMHPKTGKFIAIEVKRPGETLNKKQVEFRGKVLNGNGIHIIATCLEDVISRLK